MSLSLEKRDFMYVSQVSSQISMYSPVHKGLSGTTLSAY